MEKTSNDKEESRSQVTSKMLEDFQRFVEYHPAERLSRNVRSLLLEFLMYDGSAEAEYLRDIVIDLDGLFGLLDTIIDEQKVIGQHVENADNK